MFRLLFFVALWAMFAGWLSKKAAIRYNSNPRKWYWIGFVTVGVAGLIYVWLKRKRPDLLPKSIR
jgi:hypothetical protein